MKMNRPSGLFFLAKTTASNVNAFSPAALSNWQEQCDSDASLTSWTGTEELPGTYRTGHRRQEMSFFRKLRKEEKGATAIEYGLIAALIAVAAIGAMGALGNAISSTMNNAADAMEGA
jgi:pilus assembly protein Flp/PilA